MIWFIGLYFCLSCYFSGTSKEHVQHKVKVSMKDLIGYQTSFQNEHTRYWLATIDQLDDIQMRWLFSTYKGTFVGLTMFSGWITELNGSTLAMLFFHKTCISHLHKSWIRHVICLSTCVQREYYDISGLYCEHFHVVLWFKFMIQYGSYGNKTVTQVSLGRQLNQDLKLNKRELSGLIKWNFDGFRLVRK